MEAQPRRLIRAIDLPAVLVLLLILVATLVPWTGSGYAINRFRPGVSVQFLTSDFIANVLLFGALGFTLTLRGTRFLAALLFGMALSLSIEATQMWIPSRVANLWDWIANSSGVLLGASFLTRFPHAFAPSDKQAIRLSLAFSVSWCVLLGLSGILLRPAPITAETAYLQAPPQYSNVTRWTGTLDSIQINGASFAPGKSSDPAFLFRNLEADFELMLSGIAPPDSRVRRPLFAVSAHRPGTTIPISIWTAGDDLLISFHSLGQAVGLAPLWRRAHDLATHIQPQQRFRLKVSREQDSTCVSVGEVRDCAVNPSIDEAWMVWLPDLARWPGASIMAGILWLSAMAAPAGFYFRAHKTGIAAATLLLAGMLLVPVSTPLRPMGIQAWLIFGVISLSAAWFARRGGKLPNRLGVKSHEGASDSMFGSTQGSFAKVDRKADSLDDESLLRMRS